MAGQLAEAFTTTLDGSGNGTVRLKPGNPRTIWHVSSVQVRVSSNSSEPTANLYLGSISGQNLAGTYTGSNDTAGQLDLDLFPGQFLTVQWLGGDAGAVATATAYGRTGKWGEVAF